MPTRNWPRARPATGALTSSESTREQAAAGLSAMTAEGDVTQLRELNARYREKFWLPFIIAARNNTRCHLGAIRSRLLNTRDMEFRQQPDAGLARSPAARLPDIITG